MHMTNVLQTNHGSSHWTCPRTLEPDDCDYGFNHTFTLITLCVLPSQRAGYREPSTLVIVPWLSEDGGHDKTNVPSVMS